MKALLLGLALPLLLAACSDRAPPATAAKATVAVTAPAPAPADAAAGRTVAARDCSGCHRLDGRGIAPGIPHLAAQREGYLLASLREYRDGKRPHAGRSDMAPALTEADVRNVAAYYAGLAPVGAPSAAVPVPSPYEEGKTLAARCAGCHGVDGNGSTSGTPSLAGQQPFYFMAAVHEFQRGERPSPAMRSALASLDRLQLEKLAMYFAAQTPSRRAAPSQGDAEAGRATSAACGGCHGSNGVSGDASIPNLAGQDARYLASAMNAHRATAGHWGMQRYVLDLRESEIANVAAFFAAQAPQAAEKAPAAADALAKQCDRCHDAAGGAIVAPKMKGQDKDYLVMALRAYRDDARASSTMHRMSSAYSNVLIDSVAAWYASQPAN